MWLKTQEQATGDVDPQTMYRAETESPGVKYHVFDTDTGIDYCLAVRQNPPQVRLVVRSVHGNHPLVFFEAAAARLWQELTDNLPDAQGLCYFMNKARESAKWLAIPDDES